MSSGVVRVPERVLLESKRIAALRGQQPGDMLAAAWREYLETHREEFAAELEESARLLRDGTLEELAAFVSRNADERADAAAAVVRRRS
jgi:hypothetical protein